MIEGIAPVVGLKRIGAEVVLAKVDAPSSAFDSPNGSTIEVVAALLDLPQGARPGVDRNLLAGQGALRPVFGKGLRHRDRAAISVYKRRR